MRVIELGDRLGLVTEPPVIVGGRVYPVSQDLERHQAIEAPLPGPVDDPHPASRQLIHEHVIADDPAARSRERVEARAACREIPLVRRVARPDGRGQLVQALLDFEELRELDGQVGMLLVQATAGQLVVLLDRLEVGGEHLLELMIAVAGLGTLDGHRGPPIGINSTRGAATCSPGKASR